MTAMPHELPLSHSYNLGRLGNAGDEVRLDPDAAQRAAIARWAGILSLDGFEATIGIRKKGTSGFLLDYRLAAKVTQACVVTLEPVPAHLDRAFSRELHFSAPVRRKDIESAPMVLDAGAEEGPEEIESLHYDLAGPALEEFALALDPYPRCPGVTFTPPENGGERPQSPFAVLKSLK
jgi:hypothetical protein